MRRIAGTNAALAEILKETGELDRILDGRGLLFESTPAEPAPEQPATFYIPPPDWDQEAAERAQLEREQQQQERAQIVAEELARIEADAEPPTEHRPAKPRKRWGQEDAQP